MQKQSVLEMAHWHGVFRFLRLAIAFCLNLLSLPRVPLQAHVGSIANKDQCLQLVLFIQGALRGAALSCLRSGHSHEDIDQSFGDAPPACQGGSGVG